MNKKLKKIAYELLDMLQGAAFSFMLALILSASIISYCAYAEDKVIAVLVFAVGELMVLAAYFIFGRQNGIMAYRKTRVYLKKEELQTGDLRTEFKTGAYRPYKGVLIPLISAVPYIIFQFFQIILPNSFCEFAMLYMFGWAYYPFTLLEMSAWLNYLCIIPICLVHLAAYIYGARKEKERQEKVDKAKDTIKGNRKK